MPKRSGADIFASSDSDAKRARRDMKFWKKQVKRALKEHLGSSPLKLKKMRKGIVKAYREKNPGVLSKENAKKSFSEALSKFDFVSV